MKFMKQACNEFHKFHMNYHECKILLSYEPSQKLSFIAFKMDNISSRKRIVDTDVVNDVTSTRQSVITRFVIRFLLHDVIN